MVTFMARERVMERACPHKRTTLALEVTRLRHDAPLERAQKSTKRPHCGMSRVSKANSPRYTVQTTCKRLDVKEKSPLGGGGAARWRDEEELNQGLAIAGTFKPPESVFAGQGSVSGIGANGAFDLAAHKSNSLLGESTDSPRDAQRGQPAMLRIVPTGMCAVSRTALSVRAQMDRDFCRLLATAL